MCGHRTPSFFASSLSVFMMFLVLSCRGQQTGLRELKIGVVMPLSGGTATYGQETLKGLKMAVDEVNLRGGLKGNRIRLVVEDNRGKALPTAKAVQKLIDEEGVLVIIGAATSSNTLAGATVAQEGKTPMLTPGSTSPLVTEVGDCISRVCYIDPFQGQAMAKFAYHTLKARKAVLLWEEKSTYSEGLTDYFQKEFERLGGAIVDRISYQQGEEDFQVQMARIKTLEGDVIYLPGYYPEVARIIRKAVELNIDLPIIGGDGWESPKLFELAGDALGRGEGRYFFSSHFSIQDTDPGVQEFVRSYKGRYKEDPDAFAALGYDAGKMVAEAILRAPQLTREALKEAINTTTNFRGVTGTFSLNEKRNPVKSVIVLKVGANRFFFSQRVNP
ncbi:MAG: ABC transporter substrate-binding protein [bacterium]